MLYNIIIYSAVDAIQDAKKQFVKTCIQDADIQNILNNFVDAQTAYTKAAIAATINVATEAAGLSFNKINNFGKLFK